MRYLPIGLMSHPTGVRGLKYGNQHIHRRRDKVAPHWGAWIEIPAGVGRPILVGSHPTGVRGLKSVDAQRDERAAGRTPLGCVD